MNRQVENEGGGVVQNARRKKRTCVSGIEKMEFFCSETLDERGNIA